MTKGNNTLLFCYDTDGNVTSFKYGDTMYYYVKNLQGDIVKIINQSGTVFASYVYDAWGNVLSITDQNGNAITSETHIGNLNPFRYRGYYYDTESGFYYLMSRYYDPVTHRFINADGYFQSGGDILDANMSAYCRNNPANSIDKFGNFVFVYSFSADATAVLGAYVSINFAFDGYGNTAIQYSYIDYSENGYIGVLDASAGATLSFIWDAQSVNDLEKNTYNIGASGGYIFSAGLDLIELDELERVGGFSISGGVGIGFDVHEYTTTTKTIWYNSSKSTSKSTSKSSNITKNP